jgi:putative heme-binding domain-containing protein
MQTLERIAPDSLPETLLQHWSGYLPEERNRVLDTLFKRKIWTMACLEAIQQKTIKRGDIDAARRQLLLRHTDKTVQQKAEKILGDGFQSGRKQSMETFRPALALSADQHRGRIVFDQLCAVCHLPPKGLPMNGPDLRSITDRTKEGLYSSILDPNQSVDASYSGYSITLHDGAALYGRILSESTNHLTLRLLDGTDRQLLRSSIQALRNTGLSLMPEGLEAAMTQQELADLILFLQKFKSTSN